MDFRWVCVLGTWAICGTALGSDPLAPLSDDFANASTLSNWSRIHLVEQWNADQLEEIDIDSSRSGWMTMMPYTSSWYANYRGVLVFKEVTGNFAATTRIHPTNRPGTGAPGVDYSLAGILTRTPRSVTPGTWTAGGENYLFLSLGTADSPGTYQFEVKTTINSVSTLEISSAGGSEADIQVVRLGPYFIMLRRVQPGPWVVHRRYHRADMPATLQVGMTVYTDWPTVSGYDPFVHNSTVITGGNPDLIAEFDFFRYRTPEIPAHLEGQDFSNPAVVSDAQLLSFLGESAVPVSVSAWELE